MQPEDFFSPISDDLQRLEDLMVQTSQADYGPLRALLEHTLLRKGKRLRPALVLLAGKLHRYQPEKLLPAALALELLHTATLIHDDVIDGSPARRGNPTLNAITSGQASVLIGDYIYAQSAIMAVASQSLRVMEVFSRTLVSICDGELREILAAGQWQLSKEEYYHRIANKTASLFQTATEVGAILSEAPEAAITALRNYGYHLGMAFQIVDDLLDFVGDEQQLGKPVGSDLRQGIVTLPIIYLLQQNPHNPLIPEVFQGQASSEESIQKLVGMVVSSPAIELSYADAQAFVHQAQTALQSLPDNQCRQAMFQLADYVVSRQR